LPKNGLLLALSAQICSLSRPAEAAMCAGTKNGLDQFDWSATRAGVGLSMCETVMASVELMPPRWILVSVRFVASVERCSREPFA
jgi:hypothetical protein